MARKKETNSKEKNKRGNNNWMLLAHCNDSKRMYSKFLMSYIYFLMYCDGNGAKFKGDIYMEILRIYYAYTYHRLFNGYKVYFGSMPIELCLKDIMNDGKKSLTNINHSVLTSPKTKSSAIGRNCYSLKIITSVRNKLKTMFNQKGDDVYRIIT